MLSMSTIGEGTAFSRAKRDRTVTGL